MKPRRQLTITLNDTVFGAFADFAATAYPEQSIAVAVREACLAYMGTDPMEAARSAARRAAWLTARAEFTDVVLATLKRAGALVEAQNESAKAELRELITSGLLPEKTS